MKKLIFQDNSFKKFCFIKSRIEEVGVLKKDWEEKIRRMGREN